MGATLTSAWLPLVNVGIFLGPSATGPIAFLLSSYLLFLASSSSFVRLGAFNPESLASICSSKSCCGVFYIGTMLPPATTLLVNLGAPSPEEVYTGRLFRFVFVKGTKLLFFYSTGGLYYSPIATKCSF